MFIRDNILIHHNIYRVLIDLCFMVIHSQKIPMIQQNLSLEELVPLEILGKHQPGLTRGIWPRYIPVRIQIVSCTICTCLRFLLILAWVGQNNKVARFTLLYCQKFMRMCHTSNFPFLATLNFFSSS